MSEPQTVKHTLAMLCDEYAVWCANNNKPRIPAEDQYHKSISNDAYTGEQRVWLKSFCERWEEADRVEAAYAAYKKFERVTRSLTEDDIAALALRSGMRPAEIIGVLDTIARWRKLGLESSLEASHEVLP